MKLRNLFLAVTALAVGGAVLLTGGAAQAANGGGVPPGGVVCTDRARSDAGVWAYGNASLKAPVTWTVRWSSTAGGAEVELLRRTAWELQTVTVVAPVPGGYYRACLTNTASGPVTYRLSFGPRPGADQAFGIGPHTAVLGANGRACGEWIAGWETPVARLVGTSDVPVHFSVRVANGDGEVLREDILAPPTTAIDRVLTPAATESYEVCVRVPYSPSPPTATISWEVSRR